MHWTRIAGATILAAAVGFLIHVLYGQGIATEYVQKDAESGRLNGVIKMPYPNWVVAVASLTALMPAFGKVFLYILIQDKLPNGNKIIKGSLFSILLLFVAGSMSTYPRQSRGYVD